MGAPPIALASAQAAAAKKQKVKLLEDKRFNHIAIMIKRLPAIDIMMKSIRLLDDALKPETVPNIIQALPTAEEMQLVSSSEVPEADLEKPEIFVLHCSRIPQLHARLECWSFKLNFEEQYADLLKPVSVLLDAAETFRHSRALKQALAIVLSVGNYLNGGTNRGQADGFDISVLSQLENIKDATNKTSLAGYCVQQMVKLHGKDSLKQLAADLALCSEAMKHSLKNVSGEVRRFVAEVKNKKKLATLVAVASDAALDPFPRIMNSFNSSAENLATQLNENAENASNKYMELVKYMGKSKEYASRLTSEDFFKELQGFLKWFAVKA